MQITPRQSLMQFAHALQHTLFPSLEMTIRPLSQPLQLLTSVIAFLPLHRCLPAGAGTGRPARDRAALATAFIAKAVLNLPTTRDLIGRLRVDEPLRRLCRWTGPRAVPHESKFSRAFAEFAAGQLP